MSRSWYLWVVCLLVGSGLILGSGVVVEEDDEGDARPSQPVSDGPKAAVVDNRVPESALTVVRLSAEAEHRLGIETAPVAQRKLQRRMQLPGEVRAAPGGSVRVAAPVSGLLIPAASTPGNPQTAPAASRASLKQLIGRPVVASETVMTLIPGVSAHNQVLDPSNRIALAQAAASVSAAHVQAAGHAREARVRLEAARIKLERAEELQKTAAGPQRAVDEARAELETAKASLAAGEATLEELDRIARRLDSTGSSRVDMAAPISGYITEIDAAEGQVVSAGASLFAVVSTDPLWVRVPIYIGDVHESADCQSVDISRPGKNQERRTASRVNFPAAADPSSATVDLFFEFSNSDGSFRPGQRVVVNVPTLETTEQRVVPYSAVLYDISGGAWVYVHTGGAYVRQRVAVSDVMDGLAVLGRGPAAETRVVTAGAAELFGVEFGAGK